MLPDTLFRCDLIWGCYRLVSELGYREPDPIMSSDSISFEVTYTSISSNGDPLAWIVDLFGLHEPNSPDAVPVSPDYTPDPKEPV
nr:hypothetical protein [Tanacetum cinerariifolium]